MIPLLDLSRADARAQLDALLSRIRLSARDLLCPDSELSRRSAAVSELLAVVARDGDDALVALARRFDDPSFTRERLRVTRDEMRSAAARTDPLLIDALRRSIAQVRAYQQHILPGEVAPLRRPGVSLGLRYSPVDSVGLHVPGGKASYPSTLIMLAVPAQVAGVRRIAVTTPATRQDGSDVLLAAAHELGIDEMYRAGGTGAIGAFAVGTQTIAPVDKIAGPGNSYIQLAKRLVSGAVGVDGFYGPSEILVIADDTARPAYVAADLLAQAEHDPGRCLLLTTSPRLADAVVGQIATQLSHLGRRDAIERALLHDSAVAIGQPDTLVAWANRFAAEHVSLQVGDVPWWSNRLRHAGEIFVGPFTPVAAGDYVAGPSHTLPTNTTARFGGGISCLDFMKRTGLVEYTHEGLTADAEAIAQLARSEGLQAHARSVEVRAE